jgi:ATP-dependent helicase/nuclease subunit B
MDTVDDEKSEMDALDFGSLVHRALELMAKDENMCACVDADKLSGFLWAEAQDWVAARYGRALPLQLTIQLDSARQRLQAAAREQVRLVREGWEILEYELKLEAKVADLVVRGKIDRIDRHRETGCFRILDYKSSDTGLLPDQAHLGTARGEPDFAFVEVGKRTRRWTDLQLPLYRMLLDTRPEFSGPFELGYFNLPKAVSETGVATWEGFDDRLFASARKCAEAVVEGIGQHRFWPPAERVDYDDFETLFHGAAEECFDTSEFKKWMGKQ